MLLWCGCWMVLVFGLASTGGHCRTALGCLSFEAQTAIGQRRFACKDVLAGVFTMLTLSLSVGKNPCKASNKKNLRTWYSSEKIPPGSFFRVKECSETLLYSFKEVVAKQHVRLTSCRSASATCF